MSVYVSVRARSGSISEVAEFARIALALGVPDHQGLVVAGEPGLEVVVPHESLIDRLAAPSASEESWQLTRLDDELTLIHFEVARSDGLVKLGCGRCEDEVWHGFDADFATALTAVLAHVQSAGHRDAR